ncbi:MAG: hypothetical protein K0S19_1069 [Geminicoccaceae bacterium]|jgi:hypothetical protein|nr:hypothetical protein [Geminicoccaceae bacterium]
MAGRLKTCAYGLIAVLTQACTEPGCTLVAVPGVVVEIRDSIDGTPLAATARGVVREGAYTDSLQLAGAGTDALVRSAAYERAGVYTVIVEHEGYAQWRQDGVWVRGDDCHVETEHLSVYLQRVP